MQLTVIISQTWLIYGEEGDLENDQVGDPLSTAGVRGKFIQCRGNR